MTKALTRFFIKSETMIKKNIGILTVFLAVTSCSSEKTPLSPMYSSLDSETTLVRNGPSGGGYASRQIFYASELTNQVATIPTFTNDALNREVKKLKSSVRDYVSSVTNYDLKGRDLAMNRIETSYKKIQKLRSYLSADENDVINRYMVRIKSNLSHLDAFSNTQAQN